jgi:hypothetical protein
VFRYLFHRLDEPPTSPAEAVAILRARPLVVTEPPDAAGAGAGA